MKEAIASYPAACKEGNVASITVYKSGEREVACGSIFKDGICGHNYVQNREKMCLHLSPVGLVTEKPAPGSRAKRFSQKEIELIEYLGAKEGAVVSKEELKEVLGFTNTNHNPIEVLVMRTRKRIEANETSDLQIQTFRGKGYRLVHK